MSEHGTFCWNELMTGDVEKAKEFYTKLVGWDTQAWPGAMPYTVFKTGDKQVGGMMQITPEMGNVPPHWMAYVAVENVDKIAADAEGLGGKILVPPTDIPGVGRFVCVQDPTGAVLCFMTFAKME